MHASDALIQTVATVWVPITHIGPALGKVPNYINNLISRGPTPRCDTMAAMLGVRDYALCVILREDVPETVLFIDYGLSSSGTIEEPLYKQEGYLCSFLSSFFIRRYELKHRFPQESARLELVSFSNSAMTARHLFLPS